MSERKRVNQSPGPAFNKSSIERATPPAEGELVISDPKTAGLVLRVRPSGAKAFYMLKRHKGRLNRLKLGDFPIMTVEQARKAAVDAIHELNAGRNPADHRRAERGELTLNELWTIYKRDHLEARCSPRTARAEGYLFDRHAKALATRRLSDISPAIIKAHHAKLGATSRTSANRTIQLIRRLYNYAIRHLGYEGRTPTVAVELFREHSRERFLSRDEHERFLEACDKEGQPWSDFFRMCLATGARRSNVQAMKWADIDQQARRWIISAEQSKNGQQMTIPLTKDAIAILQKRSREQSNSDNPRLSDSPFVFPALRDKGGPGHLSQPARPFRRILKEAKIEGVTIHDLRRTAGAYMASNGASLPMIGQALGHADLRATQIYSRLDLDTVREAMEASQNAMKQKGGE